MTKLLKCVFLIIVLYLFSFTSFSFADDSATDASKQEKQESWISNGKELGKWWKKTAHNFDPLPKPLLYHLEGNISYTKVTGNVDADVQKLGAKFILRKNLFTSITSFNSTKNKQELNMKNKNISVEKSLFNQMLSYDITDKLSFGGGVMREYNAPIYLEERWTYYAGATYSFFTKPPFLLKIGAYYGYEDDTYMSDDLDEEMEGFAALPGGIPKAYDSDGVRLIEHLTWMLNERVTFLQSFDHMYILKDSKYYHWTASATIQVGITKTISFFTKYQVNYSKSLLGDQLQQYYTFLNNMGVTGYDMFNKDTVLVAGLKFSL